MSYKVLLISLGCDKNLVDSEVMLGILKEAGYEITTDEKLADIIIVNTCAFIKAAEEETITTINRVTSYNNKKVIITGCFVQKYKDKFPKFKNIHGLLGVNNLIDIKKVITSSDFYHKIDEIPEFIYNSKISRTLSTLPHTAFVKIAEGCNNRCSYCLIPKLRGNYRSREMEDILIEVKNLVKVGVKEINIIAQDTTYYGYDLYNEYKLSELLKKLCKIKQLKWIRLLYTHPEHITDELIGVIASEEKICNYIDIPMQHASERILKLMRRDNTKSKVINIIDKLRKNIKDICIRTTFIVGFPTESNKDFKELLEFVKEIKFDRLGAFTYSREKFTPAYNYKRQIPERIKIERYYELMRLQEEISAQKNKYFINQTLKVLIEKKQNNFYIGRSYRDAPNIDGVVYVSNYKGDVGKFANVKITDAMEYDLTGVSS